MNHDDKKTDKELFHNAMQSLGVEKAVISAKPAINTSKHSSKKVKAAQSKNQHVQANSSLWPTILYQDLEAEEYKQKSGLSANLTAQSVQFHQGGLNQKSLKRLNRGQYPISSRLDLHGLTIDEAIDTLNETVNHFTIQNQGCLLIIHGKGYHSQGKTPKLKNLTERWLKAHPRTIAFCSAQTKDGGTGAVYVLLKK